MSSTVNLLLTYGGKAPEALRSADISKIVLKHLYLYTCTQGYIALQCCENLDLTERGFLP